MKIKQRLFQLFWWVLYKRSTSELCYTCIYQDTGCYNETHITNYVRCRKGFKYRFNFKK